MPRRRVLIAGVSVFATLVITLSATFAGTAFAAQAGKPSGSGDPVVEVSSAVHSDVSAPLRSMTAAPVSATDEKKEKKERPLPTGNVPASQDDGAVQSAVGPLVGTTPGLNFDGIGDTSNTPSNPCNCAPPDTNGVVGATQYVQWVNTAFAVYNKSNGALVFGPVAGNTLWAGFGGGCQVNNDGDPIVQYDKAAGRWVFTQFSVSTLPFTQCVAVSTTSDATGTYNRYAFSYGNVQFNDYPKLGVWPDAYYISYNIFNNGQTFAGSKVCAFDRARMLTGAAATQQCFQLSPSFGGLLPSDLDGATAPPAGSPNFFLNFGTNSLNLWKFHVDWGNSANTTLTGPTNMPVAAFTAACNGGGACIPQAGTGNQLDSLADRLMYRLAYRNRSGTESLVVNHSVQLGKGRRKTVGVRWYEVGSPNGTPSIVQQSTYSPDSTFRWMGSIAMDKQGNMALGYSASSSSIFPAIRYTGRLATDAPSTMQSENSIISGGGSQTGALNRWGDYSAMTVDPVDDCTFWYTTEYLKASGSFNWSTRIANFKFPGCV